MVRIEGGELRHVAVQPGDLFVLTVDRQLATDEIASLREQWMAAVGNANPLVVLEGAELTVIRAMGVNQS